MSSVHSNPPIAPSRQDGILAHFTSAAPKVRDLFKVCPFKECWHPSGRVYAVDEVSRQAFLEISAFTAFARKMALIMTKMTAKDVETFGFPGHESPIAKEYLGLLDELDRNGFYKATESLFFWSGFESKRIAYFAISRDELHLQDETFLGHNLLYQLAVHVLIEERAAQNHMVGELLREAYAASFASKARGEVLYITTNEKETEFQRSLTVHNFFWNVELPILQRLRLQGYVTKITLIFFDVVTRRCKRCDLNDPRTGGTFRLYRRLAHKTDKAPERFVQEKTAPDGTFGGDCDQASQPRPAIKLNTLRKIVTHWRRYKKASHVKPLDKGAVK